VAWLATAASAQVIGPGSTIEGDYLRGLGVAGWGMGLYNLNTAEANAINLDTAIRWDQYVTIVLREENALNAQIAAVRFAKKLRLWKELEERKAMSPEDREILNGEALNHRMDLLKGNDIYDSFFETKAVPIPPDVIRKIRFFLPQDATAFSMQRLTHKEKGRWPALLRNDSYQVGCKRYEKALDNALDHALDRTLKKADLDAIDSAIEDLENVLRRDSISREDTLYKEAFTHLHEMRAVLEGMKHHHVEMVLSEIESQPCASVYELKKLMSKHGLRFAPADNPDEKLLYRTLYEVLNKQYEELKGPVGNSQK
jgi:hypothetical protein